MAEGDAVVYNAFKYELLIKAIDCVNDTFKVILLSSTTDRTPPDGATTDTGYTTDNEIAVTGYTAAGETVATPAVTQDDSNNWGKWDDDGSDITWTSLATATILGARLYDDTHASDVLCIQWEIATNSNGGDYTLQFGANGIMTLA